MRKKVIILIFLGLAIFFAWAVVYLPWPAFGFLLVLAFAAIFYWKEEASFYLLLVYLPCQIALNLFPDIDLASGRVLILIFFAVSLFKRWRAHQPIFIKKQMVWFLILIGVVSLFSFLGAQNQTWGLRKWLVFASIFPLFFLTAYIINSWPKVKKSLWAMVVGGLITAVVAWAQFLAQFIFGMGKTMIFWGEKIAPVFFGKTFGDLVVQNPSWLVNTGGRTIMRTIGFFPDPHMLAFYLGMTIFCILILLIYTDKQKKILFIIFLIMLGALLLTFSRGGYLGLVWGLAVFFFLSWRRLEISEKRFFKRMAILSLIILFLVGNLFVGRFFSIFDFNEGSNSGRISIWQESLKIAQKSPLLGVGLGNYPTAVNFNENYRSAVTSHNLYLDILTETGIFGLFVWGMFLLAGLKNILFKIKSRPKEIFLLSAGIAGALIYFLIHSFFETPIFNPTILAILMIFIGLTVNLDEIQKGLKEKNVL